MSFLEDHLGGGIWHAYPPFSSLTFTVRHLGARNYRAGFREIAATLDAPAGTVTATVPVASLDLDNPVVGERMLSPEFLDAARFAHVGRVASEFDGDERRAISAGGELSMHGGGDTLGWDVTLEALVEFVEQVA